MSVQAKTCGLPHLYVALHHGVKLLIRRLLKDVVLQGGEGGGAGHGQGPYVEATHACAGPDTKQLRSDVRLRTPCAQ